MCDAPAVRFVHQLCQGGGAEDKGDHPGVDSQVWKQEPVGQAVYNSIIRR